ncbi:MAG: APC family permease [Gemmatimonadales bacterium]
MNGDRSDITAGTSLVRAITRSEALAMVVGSMIGAGVFIVAADVVRQARYPGIALAAWGLAAVILMTGGQVYSELGGMFPRAGGIYVYLREAFSPLVGFLFGWTLFAVIWTGGTAAAATGFARFASVIFPSIGPDLWFGWTVALPSGPIEVGVGPQRLLAVASIALITWINRRGVREAAAIQAAFTLIKVGAVLALVALGLSVGRNPEALAANFGAAFWPNRIDAATVTTFAAAMVGPLFAMDGWYALCFAASEMVDAKRDLPFAMTAGTLLGGVLYVLINLAYFTVLPAAQIAGADQDRVASAVMEQMLGPVGGKLMAAAIMASSFGLNVGLLLGGARVFYAMARDGLFFSAMGRLHPTYRTPATALAFQGLWISVLCLSGTYGQLLDFTMVASLVFYFLVPVGLFVLRYRRPKAERPVRAWGYPVVPFIYAAASGWVCVQLVIQRPQYTWPGLVLLALGLPIYLVQSRRATA